MGGFLTVGPAYPILGLATQDAFVLCPSERIPSETRASLRKPEIEPCCRDPNGDHALAAALVAGADCIVTGDADLLTRRR